MGLRHRVLVIDDHPDTADMACRLFQLYGHDTAKAMTGIGAIDVLGRFDPDVAIVDLGLPDMSGFELARRIRDRCGEQIFMIAWSGWSALEDRERALRSGCDRFLLKPVEGRVLLTQLYELDARLAGGPVL